MFHVSLLFYFDLNVLFLFFVCLRIKFVGVNPIMLGLSMSSVKVMEYLLERKVSAIERDSSRGCVVFSPSPSRSNPTKNSRWNIYHYICDKYNYELLQFFFEKLPRDTSEMLLAQQSNGRLNTVSCFPSLLTSFLMMFCSSHYTLRSREDARNSLKLF